MTTKQVVLWCGDGDDGSGAAKIIDAATGQLLRENPRPHVTTDSVECYAEYGNYFYLVDSDSSLAGFDKDNVVIGRTDLGYDDSPGEALWTTSQGVHVMKRNKSFADFIPGDENLHKLVTFFHDTVNEKQNVLLAGTSDASALGNLTSKVSFISNVDRVWAADETGFWVESNNSTVFPSGTGFAKASYDGNNPDNWEPAGVQPYNVKAVPSGGYIHLSQNGSSGFSWQAVDFATKTLGTMRVSGELNTAFSAAALHNVGNLNNFSSDDYDIFVEANGSITFGFSWGGGDLAGLPALDGQGKGGGVVFFNITTAGVISVVGTPIPLPYYDNEKRATLDPKYAQYPRSVRRLSATNWVVGDNYGVWNVNVTTSTVVWSLDFPYKTQQAYSSDGEDLSILKVDTWTSYTLQGTITDAAGSVEDRVVRVHDQRTGEVVAETTALADGSYAVDVLSESPKYIVCASIDATKNYGINAHIVPTQG